MYVDNTFINQIRLAYKSKSQPIQKFYVIEVISITSPDNN